MDNSETRLSLRSRFTGDCMISCPSIVAPSPRGESASIIALQSFRTGLLTTYR